MCCNVLKQHSLTCEVGFCRTVVTDACMRDYCSVLTITQQEDKIHEHRRVMFKVERKNAYERWQVRQTTQLKPSRSTFPPTQLRLTRRRSSLIPSMVTLD
jgi:hypothetical protein